VSSMFPLTGAAEDLWFEDNQYTTTPTTLLSCIRASSGFAKTSAGALTSFGTNTLRITDLGLLIEDARTNILLQSQSPANASWNKLAATVTDNETTAPDGTSTAGKIVEDSSNSRHMFYQSVSDLANGQAATVSAYVKNGTRQYFSMNFHTGTSAGTAVFDLAGATVTHTAGTLYSSSSIEVLANGWLRLSVSIISDGTITCFVDFALSSTAVPTLDSGTPIYTGDGSSFVYVWGMQFELGAFASSYIPTTTTSATRAADAVSFTGSLDTLLKAAARTSVIDIEASGTPVTWDIVSGSSAGNELVVSNSDVIITSNTTTKNFTSSTYTFTGGVKVGAGTNGSATSVTGGGLVVATGASGTANTGTVYLGSDSTNFWFGYIRRATFWNSKLADETLQSLTDPTSAFYTEPSILFAQACL
jgi:hypothetical protein